MPTDETKNLSDVPEEVLQYELSPFMDNKALANLVQSAFIFSPLKPVLTARAMRTLLQAVIDDKRDKVKKILDHRSNLLLEDLNKMEVDVIESQYTWQTFKAERPLIMALKRNQVKMVEIILPYFEKLEDGTQKAVKQWESAEGALAKRNER